jgi:hypothetical protein
MTKEDIPQDTFKSKDLNGVQELDKIPEMLNVAK